MYEYNKKVGIDKVPPYVVSVVHILGVMIVSEILLGQHNLYMMYSTQD